MTSVDVGNAPAWLARLIYRLLMLRSPGVYELMLIVEDDGTRSLVVKNQSQPHRLEDLTKEKGNGR